MKRKIDMQKGPDLETMLKRRERSLWRTMGETEKRKTPTANTESTERISTKSMTQLYSNAQAG